MKWEVLIPASFANSLNRISRSMLASMSAMHRRSADGAIPPAEFRRDRGRME
jgi:hypothetical protein